MLFDYLKFIEEGKSGFQGMGSLERYSYLTAEDRRGYWRKRNGFPGDGIVREMFLFNRRGRRGSQRLLAEEERVSRGWDRWR